MSHSERSERPRAPETVTAVMRALDVLDTLSQADAGLRLTDIGQRTGLAKATAYRLLQTLLLRELVEFDENTQQYTLGPRILEYGLRRLQRLELRHIALPHMRRLRDETEETVTMSVVVGNQRQYVEQIESPREVRQTIELGRRVALHAGGSGKVMLAHFPPERLEAYLRDVPLEAVTPQTIHDPDKLRAELQRIRARGYAYSHQERQTGAATVAAAIFNQDGEVVGCLSVSGPYQRFTEEKIRQFGPMAREAALAISRQLGWRERRGTDTGTEGVT